MLTFRRGSPPSTDDHPLPTARATTTPAITTAATTTPATSTVATTTPAITTRFLTVLALAVASGVGLSGCSAAQGLATGFTNNAEERFYDFADYAENAVPVFQKADWVPTDATTIGVRYFTEKSGATLSFTSPTGVVSDECEPGPLSGAPELESSWWPSAEPVDGIVCGDWQVFGGDGTWYAWID